MDLGYGHREDRGIKKPQWIYLRLFVEKFSSTYKTIMCTWGSGLDYAVSNLGNHMEWNVLNLVHVNKPVKVGHVTWKR